jgi:omega-6 fatty acid desaturase (delta-12 desaturase)
MVWFQIFQDGPEYEARRRRKTFTPPDLSLKELHDAIPRHLFERSTLKSTFYIAIHILLTAILHVSAKRIPATLDILAVTSNHQTIIHFLLRPIIWTFFWGWQGMFFAGIWCLGLLALSFHRNFDSFFETILQDMRFVAAKLTLRSGRD